MCEFPKCKCDCGNNGKHECRMDPFEKWALKNRINWFRDKQGVIWVDLRDSELLESYNGTRCFNDHCEHQ